MGQQGSGAPSDGAIGIDLEEFVAETILAVFRGVRSAADRASQIDTSAVVNLRGERQEHAAAEDLSFDIALTASEPAVDGKGASPKVKVLFASDAARSQNGAISNVSRIRFKVPVSLPSRTERPSETQSDYPGNRWEV
jgi:hypothetical protein